MGPLPVEETAGTSEALRRFFAYEQRLVGQGVLQPDCRSFVQAPTTEGPPAGVALLVHGFTAGPWQFEELAPLLASRGVQCYAPRLPGHGFGCPGAGENPNLLPIASAWRAYPRTCATALAHARSMADALSVPLFVLGFSTGATLALYLSLHHGQAIRRAVAVAPLLEHARAGIRAAFATAARADAGGAVGAALDRVAFGWGEPGRAGARDSGRAGHWEFQLGHVYAVLRLASQVRNAKEPLRVPTRFVVNEADPTVRARAVQRFFWRHGGPSAHELVHVPASLRVPHSYLSPRELADGHRRRMLQELAASFLAAAPTPDERRTL